MPSLRIVNNSHPKLFFLGLLYLEREFHGILATEDLVHDDTTPTRPRTRSQVKKMAQILQESEASTNGFTSFKVLDFVHLIS